MPKKTDEQKRDQVLAKMLKTPPKPKRKSGNKIKGKKVGTPDRD